MILQQPPPLATYQVNLQDESHLNIISICHYVMSVFYLLGIGFVIMHFMIMTMVFRMAEKESIAQKAAIEAAAIAEAEAESIVVDASTSSQPGSPSELLGTPTPATAPPTPSSPAAFPKEMIPILNIIYIVLGGFLVALCVCNVFSGYYIKKRKNQIFSYIIAAINCMQFPLGTTLGVFTFIVLMRPSVKMAYGANAPS